MKGKVLVWLHGDSLSIEDAAVRRYPEAKRVFVFDEPWLRRVRPSFKRLFFLYEGARDAGAEIRLGDPLVELVEAAAEAEADRVAVTRSESPRFDEWVAGLQTRIELEVVEPEHWIEIPEGYPLRRFTPFWKKFGGSWS